MPFKLGRKPPRHDPRTLKLARYLAPVRLMPQPPVNSGYAGNVANFPMMENDQLGDCTIAAAGHMIQAWTANAGTMFTPSDAQILTGYEAVGGYVPGDPSTDNGCVMLDVLNYWRQTGIGGHKITAFVSVDITNQTEIEQAIWLFGGCYIGLNLPLSAQQTFTGLNGCPVWDTPASHDPNGVPGSWGGHCVPLLAYGVDAQNHAGTQLPTWGVLYDATWRFLMKYMEEAWAVVSMDFIEPSKLSVSGFSLADLMADLAVVTAPKA